MPKKTFDEADGASAHLIVQVKANQPGLSKIVEKTASEARPLSSFETVDKHHSRHETRLTTVFDARDAMVETDWSGRIVAIVRVDRRVFKHDAATGMWPRTDETSYYASNRPVTAETAGDAIRRHWFIENKNHHVRDVTLREDSSRIRTNPGVFARMRSFALNILRINQSDTMAQDRMAAAFGGLTSLFKMKM